ncbi:MAG: sensor histidine kinase [Myxococcota bacterium]
MTRRRLPRTELAFYEDLLEHAGVLVHSVGVDGRVLYVNDAWARVLGYTRDEARGMDVFTVVHPGSLAHCREVFRRVLAGERVERLEAVFRAKDGRRVEVEGSTSARVVRGRPVSTRGVFLDVTARKETEAALRHANADGEAAYRELEAFSWSVSHDLRGPLHAIEGYARAVIARGHLSGPCHRDLERTLAAANRTQRLVDDLLALARVGRAALRPEPVDLSALARGVIERLRQEEPARVVDVDVQDGLVAVADAGLAAVVIENLVGNAWKYTSRRARARIEVGREGAPGQEASFVRDDGAGFDLAHARHLFEPFQRMHGQEEFEGTGIGLAIVRRIVERHGGRVWAEAAVDRGATFRFTFGPGG